MQNLPYKRSCICYLSCYKFGYNHRYFLYHKDVLKLENNYLSRVTITMGHIDEDFIVSHISYILIFSPLLQVILSFANRNPAMQEHTCRSFLLLQIWLHPPLPFLSQGCTEIRK